MDKTEIDHIADLLVDIRECLSAGCGESLLQAHLLELHWVIDRLTETLLTAEDPDLKVHMAALETEARLCKQEIEERLGVAGLSRSG